MIRRICVVASVALVSAAAYGDEARKPAPVELPPESTFMRTAHAARRTGPIQLDGKLDEPAWLAAPLHDTFTQARPDEGAKATVETRFRILWDDEAIYVGFECDDPLPPTATLSRRDRWVEGDYVSFDFDTTLDRRTAYHFQVYAAGQQLDGIHFNDTDMTTDWDGAWDSAVTRSPRGWSAEVRIPLRLLRIPEHTRAIGFNLYRILSRRHEEDQWRFRPNGRPGDISRLGLLDGLEGIRPVRALELKPYVAARVIRNAPAPAAAIPGPAYGGCSSVGLTPYRVTEGCVGLDLRYNLASDLSLVATVNPDFGQVEADQRVLNLSTYETFFPEKRPFFLEGLDLFKSPLRTEIGGPYGGDAYQIFYSRRIGRAPPSLTLDTDQALVYQPSAVPVAAAAKVTGTVSGVSVGVLSAIEPRVSMQLQQPDQRVDDVRTVEARSTALLRLRAPVGGNAFVGATGTAVDPLFADGPPKLDRRHAHVGEADVVAFNDDRSVTFTGQTVGSLLTQHVPETLRDGTFLGGTASGYAGSMRLVRSKEYLGLATNLDYLSPSFNVNDLGYQPRANLARAIYYAVLRDPHKSSWYQQSQLFFGGKEVADARFANRLDREFFLEGNFTDDNFWFWDLGVDTQTPYVDDRELADGTPLERQGEWNVYGTVQTDTRKALQLQIFFTELRAFPRFERQNQLELLTIFRPLPQLEGSLDLAYNENAGTYRQIRAATALPGTGADVTQVLDPRAAVQQPRLYLLAQQAARSVSATLRTTYAFTPRLTLQAYAQLFTAGISYGAPARAVIEAGKRKVTLAELQPALAEDRAPNADERQAGLNVNLILRWEWRTGSTFYLVYAHQTSNDVLAPAARGLSLGRELSALGGPGVAHGDTLMVKLDVLATL